MLSLMYVILGLQIGLVASEIGSRLEARRHPTRTMEDSVRLRPAWLPHLGIISMLMIIMAIIAY